MQTEITRFILPSQLGRYTAVAGSHPRAVENFHLWCEELSMTLLQDVGRVDAGIRSAMAQELRHAFGLEWYAHPELFDDDAAETLDRTGRRIGLPTLRMAAEDPGSRIERTDIEETLTSSLPFDFWVRLLGRGSHATDDEGHSERRIYDTLLWQPALRHAFPGCRRRDVERAARVVAVTRHRLVRHESIVWGVPIPGQDEVLSVTDVQATVIELAGFLAPEAAAWVEAHSTVDLVLDSCPVDESHPLLL